MPAPALALKDCDPAAQFTVHGGGEAGDQTVDGGEMAVCRAGEIGDEHSALGEEARLRAGH